jgi:hypothetical protein
MSIKIYSKYAKIRDVVSANKGSGDLNFAQSFSNVIPKHADAEATRTTEAEKARVRQLLAATGGHLVGGGTQGAHVDLDEFMRDVLPPGAARVPNAPKLIAPHAHRRQAQALPGAYASQGDAQSVVTNQRPYMPEFDSPERQWLPTNRGQMNRYARMFYKLDPVVGTVLDMICDLPWGEFTLSGPEIDGSIKSAMETAVQETDLLAKLPYLLREFFVTGEAIPHLYFDSSNGIWNHLHLHNPDQIEVLHAPFIPMEPVMQFKPDPDLRKVVVSQDPMIQEVRAQMPATVINSILDGSNIPLSPVNVTLLARKMHDYDVRGTSILTRLWRVFAYEDAIFNAAIATARRQAGPLKVAKMGDAGSGYIPPPEQEAKLLRLIAQQEIDVNAWLVWNYAVQFELVGVQERVMPITQHYPLIEQIKLAALGVNKAFINGEASFSSAAAGLTVFLQRLKALREMVVNRWILPKFFGVMALANDWVKTTEAERADGVRIKRSSKELLDQGRYITPKLEWKKTLDPNIESERIQAIQTLEQIGCKFSRRTKMSLVGVDSEDERKQVIAEAKEDSALIASDPQIAQMIGAAPAPEEGGGGGMGGGMPPSIPGDAFGAGGGDVPLDPSGAPMDPTPPGPAPEGVDMGAPPSPEGAAAGDKKPRGEAGRERKDEDYVAGGWQKSFVEAGQRLLVSFDVEEALDYEPWDTILGDRDVRAALATHDPDILWEAIEDYLTEDGYPAAAVLALRGFLTSRRRRAAAAVQRNDPLRQALDKIPDSPSVTLWAGAK